MSTSTRDVDGTSTPKFLVQLVRPEKLEERMLVFTDNFIHIQVNQQTSGKYLIKTDESVKYIDISTIELRSNNQLTFHLHNDRCFHFVSRSPPNVDEAVLMAKHIVCSLQRFFPALEVERDLLHVEIEAGPRLEAVLQTALVTRRSNPVGPCGGFRAMHTYFRTYFNTPCRDEVDWDVETVYGARNQRRFVLPDFNHLDAKEWVPLLACVAYSTYFNELDTSGVKLTLDCQNQVCQVVKRNKNLVGLYMDGCSLRSDFCNRLASALPPNTSLRILDLSNNPGIEDRGVESLCGPLSGRLRNCLTTLRLVGCGLTARAVNYVADALAVHGTNGLASALTRLDLSRNSARGELLQSLQVFLAHPNSLMHVNLSQCNCPIESLAVSLARGCTLAMETLDLSGNPVLAGSAAGMEGPVGGGGASAENWGRFFTAALALRRVVLSKCRRFPASLLQVMLKGLQANPVLSAQGIEFDLSGCDLGASGADVLATFLPSCDAVVSLDISDNEFGTNLGMILSKLTSNNRLKHLAIGGNNFADLKQSQVLAIIERLIAVLQTPTTALESLSLANARLRLDINFLLNRLVNRTSLRCLDISGNAMGDAGARVLARVLSVNSELREVVWDNNSMSIQGIEEVTGALEFNRSLERLALPISDLAQCSSRNADRVAQVVTKIESALRRRQIDQKKTAERAFKLAQDYQFSKTQQCMDELIVGLETSCDRLEAADGAWSTSGEPALDNNDPMIAQLIGEARLVLEDARRSRQLLVKLQGVKGEVGVVADVQDVAEEGQEVTRCDRVVRTKLLEMADHLQADLEKHLRQSMEEMIRLASAECHHTCRSDLTSAENIQSRARNVARTHARLPRDFLRKLIRRTMESDILFKFNEAHLDLASAVTDCYLDGIIASLDESNKRLTRAYTRLATVIKRATSMASLNNIMGGGNLPSRLITAVSEPDLFVAIKMADTRGRKSPPPGLPTLKEHPSVQTSAQEQSEVIEEPSKQRTTSRCDSLFENVHEDARVSTASASSGPCEPEFAQSDDKTASQDDVLIEVAVTSDRVSSSSDVSDFSSPTGDFAVVIDSSKQSSTQPAEEIQPQRTTDSRLVCNNGPAVSERGIQPADIKSSGDSGNAAAEKEACVQLRVTSEPAECESLSVQEVTKTTVDDAALSSSHENATVGEQAASEDLAKGTADTNSTAVAPKSPMLEHLCRQRPKRPKTYNSSRYSACIPDSSGGEENITPNPEESNLSNLFGLSKSNSSLSKVEGKTQVDGEINSREPPTASLSNQRPIRLVMPTVPIGSSEPGAGSVLAEMRRRRQERQQGQTTTAVPTGKEEDGGGPASSPSAVSARCVRTKSEKSVLSPPPRPPRPSMGTAVNLRPVSVYGGVNVGMPSPVTSPLPQTGTSPKVLEEPPQYTSVKDRTAWLQSISHGAGGGAVPPVGRLKVQGSTSGQKVSAAGTQRDSHSGGRTGL